MAVTLRKCLICGKEMQCHRASKILCSNICSSRLHKLRIKLNLSHEEMTGKLQKGKTENEQ